MITTEIENILAERVIELQIKGLHPSIILMNKYTFKELIKSINKSCKIVSLKDYKKNQKWFFGVKIYITKDLSNG